MTTGNAITTNPEKEQFLKQFYQSI